MQEMFSFCEKSEDLEPGIHFVSESISHIDVNIQESLVMLKSLGLVNDNSLSVFTIEHDNLKS